MKKRILVGILAVGMCFSLCGCKIGSTDYVLDVTHVDRHSVFQINTAKCEIEEAKLYLCNYKNLYGSAYGVDLWDYDFGEASLEEYVKAVTLSELTRVYCMDLLAEEQNVSLSEAELSLCDKAADVYYATLTNEEKDYIGLSKSSLKTFFEHYALAQKLYETLTEGVNEEVSDDEARVVRLQRIYVKEATTADEVAAKLAAGDDFALVAQSYNQASEMEITAARGDLPENVEEIVFDMENNAVSQKIEADEGFYFVKCLSKYEESLTEANKLVILARREKEQFNDVYDAYLENADKALNETFWSEVTIDANKNIVTDSFFATYDTVFKAN